MGEVVFDPPSDEREAWIGDCISDNDGSKSTGYSSTTEAV